jgi:solute:Na+ symporter, SSS family
MFTLNYHAVKQKFVTGFVLKISVLFFLFVFTSVFAGNPADVSSTIDSDKLKSKDWLQFSKAPEIPVTNGIAGAFVGKQNKVLIVAGGFNFQNGGITYHDDIYVLSEIDGSPQWRHAGKLPRAVACGASVVTPLGLLCIGGEDEDSIYDDVFLIVWDEQTEKITLDTSIADLPEPITRLSADILGTDIFIAGGRNPQGEIKRFSSLSLQGDHAGRWRDLPAWPGPARSGAVLTVSHIEDGRFLYLFSGRHKGDSLRDGYRYDPQKQAWQVTSELPRAAVSAAALAAGQSHILLFSGFENNPIDQSDDLQIDSISKNVLSYHTVTNAWSVVGHMPEGAANSCAVELNDKIFIPGGQVGPDKCTDKVQSTTFQSVARRFGFLDQFCLYTYLALLMLLGFWLYYFRDQSTSEGYFLGGRNIPGWAAGLSLMATGVSSIGFMAIPAKTFVADWTYFVGVLSWVLVIPIVILGFLPFFMKFRVTTAYELLERRFDIRVRTFAAAAFSLMEIGRISIVLLLPATALATVTNLSTEQTILLMGIITTVYTVSAGMQGVIWSDVCQGFLMIGGAVLCIAMVLIRTETAVGELFSIANADAKFKMFHLDWSPTSAGLWVVLVGNVFNRVSSMTSNQASVQRFLSTSDQKQATKTVLTGVIASIPWAVIVFLLGTALYVHYKLNPQALSPQVRDIQVLPFFMAQELPPGLSGVIIAAIFAAGMSSIDSSIHSLSTTWTNDFLGRFCPKYSEKAKLFFAKSIVVFLGIVSTAGALIIYYSNIRSMWDFFIAFFGLFSGVLCGIFVLAIFFKRVKAGSALLAAIASFVIMQFVWYKGLVHPLLYAAVGVVVCVLLGYVFSLAGKPTSECSEQVDKS